MPIRKGGNENSDQRESFGQPGGRSTVQYGGEPTNMNTIYVIVLLILFGLQ